MKKFLIAVILIIPIIIIVTISLTGQAISYALKNVQVERIVVSDIYNSPIDLSKTIVMEITENGFELKVDTYPAIAYDHTVEAKQTSGDGKVEFVNGGGKKYSVKPIEGGEVTIIISSVTNVNAFAKLNFYISSKKLGQLSIFTSEGKYIQDEVYNLDKETNLYLEAYPLESIIGKNVKYKSSNENIATIDANGKLTPITNGICSIDIEILDNLDNIIKKTINISTEGAIIKNNDFYSSKEFTVDDVKDKLLINKNAQVTALGNNSFDVKFNGITERLVGNIVDSQEWKISDSLAEVFMYNGGAFLSSEYLDVNNKNEINAVYSVSDHNIIEVSGNQLLLKKTGTTTLTATHNGKSVNREISVKKRPSTYQLKYTQEDNLAGIKGERVWAINTFSNFELKTTKRSLDVGVNPNSVYPKDATLDFFYTISDETVASIDQNGIVQFEETAVGKTLTAKAYYVYNGIITSTFKSYDIKVLDDKDAYNVSNQEEAKYIYNDMDRAIVLQNDLTLPTLDKYYNSEYFVGEYNVHGNGYSIYNNATIASIICLRPNQNKGKIVFENVFLYNRSAEEYTKGFGNNAMYISGFQDAVAEGVLESNHVTVKYCYIAYASTGINAMNMMRLTVESTIFSNLQAIGVSIMVYRPDDTLYTFDKVIVKDCEALTFASLMNLSSKELDKGFPPVVFKNFVDSYAWSDRKGMANVVKMLDLGFLNDFIPGMNLGDALSKEVASVIETVFTNPEYQNLKLSYKAKGEKEVKDYYHLGGMMLGFYAEANTSQFTDETKDFMAIPFSLNPKLKITILGLTMTVKDVEKMIAGFLQGKDMNLLLTKQNVFVSYNFKDNKPKFYPDDICPTDEKLLIRLRDKIVA